jgi:chromosome segregation ATPase
MSPAAEQPFDHNGECRHCDEPGMHRADCPWLVARLDDAENYHLLIALMGATDYQSAVRALKALSDERDVYRAGAEDSIQEIDRLHDETTALRAAVDRLTVDRDECVAQDRLKTREINLLVPEVKAATAEIERLRRNYDELMQQSEQRTAALMRLEQAVDAVLARSTGERA